MEEELKFDKKNRTITLEWNRYKGDGKTWCAKIRNGKFEFLEGSFETTSKTGRGVYGGLITYKIEEDGEYIAHKPSTKRFFKNIFFEVKNGNIEITKITGN